MLFTDTRLAQGIVLLIAVTGRNPRRLHGAEMTKLMSKSELVQKLAERHPTSLTRDDIKDVLDALAEIGHAELKKTGAFLVHGFAKFVVVEKPAAAAHEGINPFTKQPMMIEAKPARKIVRARLVKAIKDAVS